MAKVEVERAGSDQFRVTISEGGSRSRHRVTATAEHLTRYGGSKDPERLIQRAFGFLLERESREAILSEFELPVIESYFPEVPRVIRGE
jgi:hypothetical protein